MALKISKYLSILFIFIYLLTGCTSDIPSTQEIEKDIGFLDKEIEEANVTIRDYSGGLLATLTNVRLETLKSTKAMLIQKKSGIKRFIQISYSVDGKNYSPPANKEKLLQDLDKDLKDLRNDLDKAEVESAQYGSGLLKILSLTKASTVKNSIAFLDQRRLLLKYDIPYYSILPNMSKTVESDFEPTPGDDIDKF